MVDGVAVEEKASECWESFTWKVMEGWNGSNMKR